MKLKELDPSTLRGKIDFGIITIREDEYAAVLDRLPTDAFIKGRQTYAFSRLKNSNDEEYLIASVRCPEQGTAQGQAVAHNLIEDLDPQWILVVGIAGSVPDDEYTLGDVLLAVRLHDFSVSASVEDAKGGTSQQFAVKGGPMHPAIQGLLASLPAISPHLERWNTDDALRIARPSVKITAPNLYGDDKWKKKVREALNPYFGKDPARSTPKAFTGSIASSDVLVKNTKLLKQWQTIARQINGIEMELAGVYHAAWGVQKPVLAIRGISDIVGFKRSPAWTKYACSAAAAFMLAILRWRPIIPLSLQPTPSAESIRGERADAEVFRNFPVSVFISPPPKIHPIQKDETLHSNLLELSYFPEKMYSVQTPLKEVKDVWAALTEHSDNPPNDWLLKGDTLLAFHDFSDSIWQDVCDPATAEPHWTAHWSESRDFNRKAEFIELLRNCLKEWGKLVGLKYIYKQTIKGQRRSFKYLYYAPTSDLTDKSVNAKSLVQARDKKVFVAYRSKEGKHWYYRHHALRFEFVRFDDKWYIELNPTFHFTWDGFRVSYYYEDLIKKLRQFQKNNAVLLLVLFWTRVLQHQTADSAKHAIYPYLRFGELVKFPIRFGVRDELWMNKEPIEKEESGRSQRRRRRPTSGTRRRPR